MTPPTTQTNKTMMREYAKKILQLLSGVENLGIVTKLIVAGARLSEQSRLAGREEGLRECVTAHRTQEYFGCGEDCWCHKAEIEIMKEELRRGAK